MSPQVSCINQFLFCLPQLAFIVAWLNGIDEQFTIAVLEGKDPASMKPIGLNLTANGKTGTYVWTVSLLIIGNGFLTIANYVSTRFLKSLLVVLTHSNISLIFMVSRK